MLVAETAFYVAMVCGERRKAEDRVIRFSSGARTLSLTGQVRAVAYMHPARTLEQIVRDEFTAIPGVINVNVEPDNGRSAYRNH